MLKCATCEEEFEEGTRATIEVVLYDKEGERKSSDVFGSIDCFLAFATLLALQTVLKEATESIANPN